MEEYYIVGMKLCTSTNGNFMTKTVDKQLPTVDIPDRGEVRRYKIDDQTFAYISPHLPSIRRSVIPSVAAMQYGFQEVTVRQDGHVIIVTLSEYTSPQRQYDFQQAIMGHIVRVLRNRPRTECPASKVEMIDNETGGILGTYSF